MTARKKIWKEKLMDSKGLPRIAAHAAEEDLNAGLINFTAYWLTLKEGGVINEKYPGGTEKQAVLLEAEGHHVIQKGKKWIVEDWKKTLVKL